MVSLLAVSAIFKYFNIPNYVGMLVFLTLFLMSALFLNWKLLSRERRILGILLTLGFLLLSIAILVNVYILKFFTFSIVHTAFALAPTFVYSIYIELKNKNVN